MPGPRLLRIPLSLSFGNTPPQKAKSEPQRRKSCRSMRKKVGARYCTFGNCLPDCCMALVLPHCSIAQEARAARSNLKKGQSQIAWHSQRSPSFRVLSFSQSWGSCCPQSCCKALTPGASHKYFQKQRPLRAANCPQQTASCIFLACY